MKNLSAAITTLSFAMLWDAVFWLLTSIVQCVVAWRQPSNDSFVVLSTIVTIFTACRTIAPSLLSNYPNKLEPATNARIWRQPVHPKEPDDKFPLETYAPWQGLTMSRVLIPFLFRAASTTTIDGTREIVPWHDYTTTATVFLAIFFWGNRKFSIKAFWIGFLAVSSLVLLTGFLNFPWNKQKHGIRNMLFAGTWMLTFNLVYDVSPLHSVFTKGELTVVTCGIALAVAEMVVEVMDPTLLPYQSVALVGCVGCGAAIALLYGVDTLQRRLLGYSHNNKNFIELMARLAFLVSVPLLLVEYTLRKSQQGVPNHPLVPFCLDWLWRFLTETESERTWHVQVSFPRYGWLLYWVMNLALAAILLPALHPAEARTSRSTTLMANKVSRSYSTVVVRKFFHGLAVILFTPVAIFAPELLSLSYAIATALLMVMEYVRSDMPMVQDFYNQYLDPSKDNGAKVIVSHTALILGCAIPHWIADCCFHGGAIGAENNQHALVLLLRLWGVISLGIGDALGAIVGTWYGRTLWGGPTRRTVEGSTAMCAGMALACYCLVGTAFVTIWMPVVVLTTLLEVATLQIDNLVLPLAGSAWILFLPPFAIDKNN